VVLEESVHHQIPQTASRPLLLLLLLLLARVKSAQHSRSHGVLAGRLAGHGQVTVGSLWPPLRSSNNQQRTSADPSLPFTRRYIAAFPSASRTPSRDVLVDAVGHEYQTLRSINQSINPGFLKWPK